VRVVDGDVTATRGLEQPLERLVARQARVAVELGCEHLDSGARRANAELHVRLREDFDETGCVRRAGGARYAKEDAHRAPISGPWRRSGTRQADRASACRAPRTSA